MWPEVYAQELPASTFCYRGFHLAADVPGALHLDPVLSCTGAIAFLPSRFPLAGWLEVII